MLIVMSLWCAIGFPSLLQAQVAQTAEQFEAQLPVRMRYLIYRPPNYASRDRWPLLLFLHGAGERGEDLNQVKLHGPPRLVERGHNLPFVIVSPQCPPNRDWRAHELNALLDEVIAKNRIDPDRIYVTGLSMGGAGTWALAAYAPDRFAALVPICGGGEGHWTKRFAHVPVWAFHGARDTGVPLRRTEEMVQGLQRAGGKPTFTIYPEAGHDAWTETYYNPALYEWLLQQKRTVRPTN